MKTLNLRNSIGRSPLRSGFLLIALALGYFALSAAPKAFGVVPAPDGCYPGFTTAEGCGALNSLTTGTGNTGVGWYSLYLNSAGNYNTGVGAGTLVLNNADSNTAVGTAALLLNTTGTENVAVGTNALVYNDSGFSNCAVGTFALFSNAGGQYNSAFGYGALLGNVSGFSNTAIGAAAGVNIDGNGNVCIGATVTGEAGVSDTTYIRNVNTLAQPIVGGIDGVTVRLSDGRLGHGVSSRRYKQDIKPMDKASDALYALKPVTFHYNKEIDPMQTLDFGLIAEEVAEVNPELAVRDGEGKISNYRRDAVNAMLLNEFLKEHRKVQEQEATIVQLKTNDAAQLKEIKALAATLKEQASEIQKVSAQVELQKAAPQTVLNKQ
jgi:hypothetical protein